MTSLSTIQFVKNIDIINLINKAQLEYDQVVIYIDNRNSKVNKFGKINQKILAVYTLINRKISQELQINNNLIYALNKQEDQTKDEPILKVLIQKETSTFNEIPYHPSRVYKVSDDEVLKLKLLQKQKAANEVNYDFEIII